jgi:hypothetical protein
MEISQSVYYNRLKRTESARSLEDRRQSEIKKKNKKSRETYDSRRIRKDMIEDGGAISWMRTSHLMKQHGLESKTKRKFKATTNSEHGRPVAANVLDREFRVDRPDRVYAGDITYSAPILRMVSLMMLSKLEHVWNATCWRRESEQLGACFLL